MVKRRIPGTDKSIQVYGWGEEAEQAAETALVTYLAKQDARLKPADPE